MEPTDQEKNAQLPPITGRANITLEGNTLKATGYAYWAHEVDAAIVELGGDPKDKAWDKWDVGHLFAAAQLARELKAAYGVSVSVGPTRQAVTITAAPSVIEVSSPPATVDLAASNIEIGPPVLGTPSLTQTRYVYLAGGAKGHSRASGDATVIQGGDRLITVSDFGTGSDTVSVTRSVNKGGRPSLLTPKAERSIIDLRRRGINQQIIADQYNVSVSTVKRVERRYRRRQP